MGLRDEGDDVEAAPEEEQNEEQAEEQPEEEQQNEEEAPAEAAEEDAPKEEDAEADPEAPPEDTPEDTPDEENKPEEEEGEQDNSSEVEVDQLPPFEDLGVTLVDSRAAHQQGLLRRAIAGMWASRDMLREDTDKQIVMKTTLRELILYVLFLFVIVYATFSQYSEDFFLLRSRVRSLFDNQMRITTMGGFWEFAEGELIDGLYWEELYNKGRKNTEMKCPTGELANYPCPVPAMDRNVMYENRLLGVPRIRQLRVSNDSCNIHPDFKKAIKVCFGPYVMSSEDTKSFHPGIRKFTEESAWSYATADAIEGSEFTGKLTTYSGSGSIQPLHYQKNVSLAILAELKQSRWIDMGTRFIAIDFTVYNANINLFAVVKLTFEFPPTGGVIPRQDIQIVKLLKYSKTADYVLVATEIIFCVFILYYIIEESIEIKNQGFAYFKNMGNLLDIMVIMVSFSQISLNFVVLWKINDVLEVLLAKPFEYSEFSVLSSLSKVLTYLSALNVFVAWVKVFKYLSFNKTMTQLSGTLSSCSKDLSGFSVMFFIIFFAFAQLGYLLFGTQVEDFMHFIPACYTLFRTILGDFNFVVIEQADRFFGPIYFLSYIFFVFFVLLNMFLAIINDTYGEVKAELKSKTPEFQLADFFKVGVNNVKGFAGIVDRKLDVENAVKMAAADDGFVTYNELRENLKASNFSDLEIDLFFLHFQEDPAMMGVLVDEDEEREKELEEERMRQMELMMMEDEDEEEDEDDEDDDDDEDDEDEEGGKKRKEDGGGAGGDIQSGGLDFGQRPFSGKQARQMRSARIRSAMSGGNPVEVNQFYGLQERVSRMESSIGPISLKLDAVIGKLDDMKRAKRRKKEAANSMITTINSDDKLDDAAKKAQVAEVMSMMSRPGTSK